MKARKQVQPYSPYLENVVKQIQSNKEDVNINEPNLLKEPSDKKQRFKGNVHIPNGVNLVYKAREVKQSKHGLN